MTSGAASIRICHVITGLNTGGAEMFLCRLLENLRPPRFEHTVVCLLGEGVLSERAAAAASVRHLGMRRSRILPTELWRLRHVLREAEPDLIHGWMYHANLVATVASFGRHVPVIWGVRQSLYDVHRERRNTRVVIRVGRALSNRPKCIVYNSRMGKRQHESFGFSSRHGMVIPNGFDVGQFRPDAMARQRIRAEFGIGNEDLVIGLVARWHPMKDHENFLRAAEQFVHSHPRTIFMLVGEELAPENPVLMGWIRERNLQTNVRLCGRRRDIPEIDAALDIASSSSSWGEGFPNAIGEAMACGVPCVATDVGEAPEIIGDTGIVVSARDPEALCLGWETLANMTVTARREMGLRARQSIGERYSLQAVALQYANTYFDVAEEP